MANGLDSALERFAADQFEIVAKAFDYFELPDVAAMLRRLAAGNGDYGLGSQLGTEYREKTGQRRPSESLIEAAFKRRLREEPDEFAAPPIR